MNTDAVRRRSRFVLTGKGASCLPSKEGEQVRDGAAARKGAYIIKVFNYNFCPYFINRSLTVEASSPVSIRVI